MSHRRLFGVFSSLGALVLASCLQPASAPSPSPTIPSPSATATSPPTTLPTSSPTPTTAVKRSPTPVAAERPSDLVVRFERAGDTGGPVPWAVLTADGQLVTRTDDNELRERRLTPAGVQRLREELAATGLFERDQRFPLEVRPDVTPPAHGIGSLLFKVWRDPRIVEVQTPAAQGAEEVYYQPSPARTRLDRLSMQLTNLETWLPADAWADPTPRPYEARTFALLLGTEVGPSGTPTIETLTMTWPFSVGPLNLGDPLPTSAGGPLGQTTRCSVLTKDDMLALRDAVLRAGGADTIHTGDDGSFGATFASQDGKSNHFVIVVPLLPDRASCSGFYL